MSYRHWFSFGSWSASVEASRARPELSAGFWLSEEGGVTLHVRCPFWLSLTVTPPWPWRAGWGFMRSTGAGIAWDGDIGGGSLRVWAEVGHDDSGPGRRGRRWSVDLVDVVLGHAKYEQVEHGVSPVMVEMPEGFYDARVTIARVRWKRPRWFARWYWRNSIEIAQGGLPFPGKGENSWDCDDDATHAVTFAVTREPASAYKTAHDAAMDALRTRAKRGGLNWKPARGWHPDVVARSA